MQISNKEISSTKTRAIRCDILTRNSVYSAHPMKFITPSSLQKAVEYAKYDLEYIISQSLHKNDASETSKHPMKIKLKDTFSTLSSSSSQTNYAVKTNCLVRRQDQILSCEEIIFPRESKDIESKVYIPRKRISIPENSRLSGNENKVQIKEHLSEEDIKWLGKNYSVNRGGKVIFKNMESKLHCEAKCSRFTPPQIKKSEGIQSSVHKTATDLINRVDVREQQLWRQLAEMSLTSVRSSSSCAWNNDLSYLENYQPSSINLSQEQIAVEDMLDLKNCTEISLISSTHRIPISTSNIVCFLDEEWLNNLLKSELGMLKD